jgi:hypothetical protein
LLFVPLHLLAAYYNYSIIPAVYPHAHCREVLRNLLSITVCVNLISLAGFEPMSMNRPVHHAFVFFVLIRTVR